MTMPTKIRKDHLDALAVGILLVCCMFWGFQQVLVKATVDELPPVFQSAVRGVGATLLLWLWCQCRGVRLFERDGSLWAGLLVGCLFAAEFAFIYIGLKHTSASRLTVFLYTSPFWVAALVPLFIHTERLRPLQWLGMACAFAAVVFALREGFGGGGATGDLMGLAAGALWGLTTVAIRAANLTRLAPEKLLFYQLGISSLVLALLSLLLGESWGGHWSGFAIGSVAVQTVVGAFASYLAWMWMLGRYPSTQISAFVFLTPLFALLFGMLWLGESVTLTLALSLALVAVGIVLVNRQ
ncbi:EamA family transporter [Limnohabitans planktonicus II-D5]|uniref:EamA family transporter n=2 Tax=Limnohabitans planktonicus TaxID=540060 RepID=A0A2T7U9P1_9BURK|nr:DMT family transporter [Limnohabitans planktonicus]PVE41322.1 EamA family transporter [Limnohabitans planktonicus II-D5]|eukprot:gene4061-3973_t